MAVQCFSAVVVTPGTPQQLTGTTVPAQAAASGSLAGVIAPRGAFISFQANPLNTAAKSIFWGSGKGGGTALNVAAKTGIGGQLLPTSPIFSFYADSEIDLGDFWIDTDSSNASTEKLWVTVIG